MSKKANYWEQSVSSIIPYLKWDEMSDVMQDSWEEDRHSHAAYELHIIISGECSLSVDDKELTMCAGQGLLIAPGVFHAPSSVVAPFSRMSAAFILNENMLEYFVLPKQGSFLVFHVDDVIKELCLKIIEEAKQQNNLFHKELISNQFAELILRIFRSVKDIPEEHLLAQPLPVQQDDMSIIDNFFSSTPPGLRTKENLAKQLHCSERHVLRKINDLYGIGFHEKQMISMVDTAKHLLRTTDKPIDEIGKMVGCASKATLYRAFKICANTTPTQYRKMHKNNN